MQSQKRLRDELRFMSEFHTLCDVIQQGAVSRLARMEEYAAHTSPLMDILHREFFPLVPRSARRHPLMRGGAQGRMLIVITSDEGLVGPLHGEVMRRAQALAGRDTRWVMVGQRGVRLLGPHTGSVRVMPMPAEDAADDRLRRLSQLALQEFAKDHLKDVLLVAPRFLSTTHQDVVSQVVLPVPCQLTAEPVGLQELVIEPSLERVVEALASVWVQASCRERFWSARRAECAARALHMERSRYELGKHAKRLQHEFFKTIHQRVDVMVRETCVVQRLSAAKKER